MFLQQMFLHQGRQVWCQVGGDGGSEVVPEAMWPAHKVDPGHEGGREKKRAISDETLAAHKIDPGHKNQQMWPAHTIDLQHVRTTQCGQPIKLTLVMKVEGKIRELSVVGLAR